MNRYLKFIFDRIASFIGLIFFMPFIIIISFSIILFDGFPVFFIQKRVGRKGKLFKMIKFRTMKKNDETNTVSIKGDKRITKIGAFLRKYKLDELPELLNIFIGQMSFVGPRPDVPGYADLLEGETRKILELRPGLTGPATLKYYNEEEILSKQENPNLYNDQVIFPDKVKINLEYFYNNTLLIDIKIIFATIFKNKTK